MNGLRFNSLKRVNMRLVAENEQLKKEVELLKKEKEIIEKNRIDELALSEEQVATATNTIEQYHELLIELSDLKDTYKLALSEVLDMRDSYAKQYKNLLKKEQDFFKKQIKEQTKGFSHLFIDEDGYVS